MKKAEQEHRRTRIAEKAIRKFLAGFKGQEHFSQSNGDWPATETVDERVVRMKYRVQLEHIFMGSMW